ncbi:cell wall glucanase (Scw11), putative [Talaromyces stipitatus ATCC 10500]|uniref:Probable beta-glucosidase btgE n=1 Tax=Talaromyces stipitatus (strain ATCC 10500 / CBS 375.48 / QM 6759 / NRRL 1006) TaxID=441959 RepID=B8MQH6_TALSN|nr:cell wall glucanase (Scw11), putative [Talaromyces stipitatus ATCC 10500]EED13378.1 cell wall glucanase (Scw11), putative [Talaromyces stipitatus ATCC 10500]
MKAAFWTAAAALMGSAMAHDHHHRHEHAALHRRGGAAAGGAGDETCGCYTSVVTYWGAPTLVQVTESSTPAAPEPTTTSTSTTTLQSTSYSTVTVQASTSTPVVPLPTASVTVFPTPGTYTIPGTTVTVTSSTVVPEATTTVVPSGTHTVGGVTTVVETSTTVVCPYATVSPVGSTFTSVIQTTTYVCPSAGTYTIAPITTTVPASTVIVYPTPATVTPGTYTQPEQTVTVVSTSYTYVCPFATSSTSTPAPAPAAPTTTAAPAPAPVASTSTSVAPAPAPVASTSTSVAPAPVSPSSTSTSAPAPSHTSTPSSGCGLGQHDQYAVTYTGYTHDTGACMSADQVLPELKNIQANGFYAIRMYSTDCNQLETVASQAIGLGLKVILGVYIDGSGVSSGHSQVSDIVNWGKSNGWDGVEFISLDNEALSDGFCSASDLAGFVSSAKETIKAAGYSGQFTVAEPLNVWQSSGSTLCSVVDFASANLQAFFNSDVAAETAGDFVASEVEILKGICNNDQVFVSESGWPNAGDSNGKAIPGAAEQKAAMDGIRKSIGSIAAQFSYKNDHWKNPGSFGVEQFWGISDILSNAE